MTANSHLQVAVFLTFTTLLPQPDSVFDVASNKKLHLDISANIVKFNII